MIWTVRKFRELAVPLIELTMGPEIAADARTSWAHQRGDYQLEMWSRHAGRRLIGICGLGNDVRPGAVWLSYFAVHPNYQGQGIGRALFAETERRAVELGYRWLYIETYPGPCFKEARNFYRRANYRLVHIGRHTLHFRKRLPDMI